MSHKPLTRRKFPTPTPDLRDCVRKALSRQRQRVFPLIWEGETLWIKRSIPSKRRFFHRLQKGLSMFFSWHTSLFNPTFCTGGSEALSQEAQRLKEWSEAGIRTPRVVAFEGSWMALTHEGVAVSFVLENHRQGNPDKIEDRLQFLLQAAQALLQVHQKGFCLGSGRLRDMVYDGAQFSFIDGEEDPSRVMTLEAAQARDILFFVLTSLRHFSTDPQWILPVWQYFLQESSPSVVQEIKKLRPYLRCLKALEALPSRWWGRDLKEAILWAKILTF